MTTFERFEVEAAAIPIHPQPSFYETTRVTIGDGHAYVDHKQIEPIMTRPKWNYLAADRKARATAYSKRALRVAGEKPDVARYAANPNVLPESDQATRGTVAGL